jgi:hypothetical protein
MQLPAMLLSSTRRKNGGRVCMWRGIKVWYSANSVTPIRTPRPGYLRSLGYEAEHEQKVLAVMEGRGPAKALNFADKKKGSPDLVIRRAGTQNRVI